MRDDTERAWVMTDVEGRIVGVNAAAEHLLAMSFRGLSTRSLLLFFGERRGEWLRAAAVLRSGERLTDRAMLRPKDRRPIAVEVEVQWQDTRDGRALWWSLRPADRLPEPSDPLNGSQA